MSRACLYKCIFSLEPRRQEQWILSHSCEIRWPQEPRGDDKVVQDSTVCSQNTEWQPRYDIWSFYIIPSPAYLTDIRGNGRGHEKLFTLLVGNSTKICLFCDIQETFNGCFRKSTCRKCVYCLDSKADIGLFLSLQLSDSIKHTRGFLCHVNISLAYLSGKKLHFVASVLFLACSPSMWTWQWAHS